MKHLMDFKKLLTEMDSSADCISVNVPLMIRIMEYAKEDAKTDMDLHKVAENLVRLGRNKTLTMADYEKVVNIK